MIQNEYTGRRILEVMHGAVRYTQSILDLVEKAWPPGAVNVLEFGAGDGAFVRKFRAKGADVDCVEIDQELRRSLQTLGGRVFVSTRGIADESYDFIYSINVLEHIPDLIVEAAELRRVLRPGGTLFVFVPAFPILWTSLDTEVGHVTRFTRASLMQALGLAGFRMSRVAYFDSLGFPAALTVRLLEKMGLFSYSDRTVEFYDGRILPLSRALDGLFHQLFGKNLVAVAHRD
jgi:SAM-dependent methyltransferase